jgi:hypothetical protein
MTVEFSNSPVMAFDSRARLVAGVVRREDGWVDLYLDARYLNRCVSFPPGEGADLAERAWIQTFSSHLFVRFTEDVNGPVPAAAL